MMTARPDPYGRDNDGGHGHLLAALRDVPLSDAAVVAWRNLAS